MANTGRSAFQYLLNAISIDNHTGVHLMINAMSDFEKCAKIA
jgi:hypothetical protein